MQLRPRIRNANLLRWTVWLIRALTAVLVVGRLVCGVHWLSDILGGALLSAGLVELYVWAVSTTEK